MNATDTSADVADPSRWHGLTAVSRRDGTPLLVYHGTQAVFDNFVDERMPVWFTDKWKYADAFSAEWGSEGRRSETSRVISAYLLITNPYRTDDWTVTEGDAYKPEWREELMRQGYDGVIFEEEGEIEYIVFRADQIMVADRNAPKPARSATARARMAP